MPDDDALKKLSTFMPHLKNLKRALVLIKVRLTPIQYYEKFKFGFHPPSNLPIHELQNCVSEITKTKDLLLKFKAEFNENQLKDSVRNLFLGIFIQITKEDPLLKDEIKLGETSGLWIKTPNQILEKWETMEYAMKFGYSKQCFGFISSYLHLISLISQLEDLV